VTDLAAALGSEIERIGSLLADLERPGLRRPVRACPGWDVAEVVRHLGGVHRWATAIVATGHDGSVDADQTAARAPDSAHPADLRDWFVEGAQLLCAELAAASPDRRCWTLAGDGTASFWVRRQAVETAVHRVDVELALGCRPDVGSALAVEGLDELVTVLAPRQVRLGRTAALPGRLTLTATDAARTWQLGVRDTPSATLSGPAAPLLLALWGRLDLDESGLDATGDPAVLAAALAPGGLAP
jgi:uncharacterized protein (TIGR03083 family)